MTLEIAPTASKMQPCIFVFSDLWIWYLTEAFCSKFLDSNADTCFDFQIFFFVILEPVFP